MLAITGIWALTDFESLLYHGRAALDRLTFAVAKQTYNQDCDKFQKLPKILNNFKTRGSFVEESIAIIEYGISHLQGILIDHKDGKTGLRSLLAHSKSTGEATNHVFTVHRNSENKVIYFDLDMHENGVINTAHKLNMVIPYVMLNIISLFSGYSKVLEFEDFHPSWEPRCICLTDYVTKDGSGVNFTTIRSDYYANTLINFNVRNEIFLHAEEIKI